MNCNALRKYLLASEQPARPPGPVAGHLAECAECRDWQQQLVKMERLVPYLPVARSSGKVDLVREVLHGPTYGPNRAGVSEGWQRRERGLRKLAVAAALAAGLLLCAFGIWIWQRQPGDDVAVPGPRHPAHETLADRLARHDHRIKDKLDAAKTPGERVAVLADAADQLFDRAKSHSTKPAEAAKLARLYDEVVREGILTNAREMPDGDRADLLTPIADQLARAESEARTLATKQPDAAGPLRDFELAARHGQQKLRDLIRGQAI
jgi:hypothetical protein